MNSQQEIVSTNVYEMDCGSTQSVVLLGQESTSSKNLPFFQLAAITQFLNSNPNVVRLLAILMESKSSVMIVKKASPITVTIALDILLQCTDKGEQLQCRVPRDFLYSIIRKP